MSDEFNGAKIISNQMDLSANVSLNSPKNEKADAAVDCLKDMIPELVVFDQDWQKRPVPSSLQQNQCESSQGYTAIQSPSIIE